MTLDNLDNLDSYNIMHYSRKDDALLDSAEIRRGLGMRKDSDTTIIADNTAGKVGKISDIRKGSSKAGKKASSKAGKTVKVTTSNADRVVVIDAVRRLDRTAIANIAAVVREAERPLRTVPLFHGVVVKEAGGGQEAAAAAEGDERLERLLGPQPSEESRIANEFATTMRGFERRRQVLRDSLTATQVATALGVSRETVYGRAERGQLLAANDRGQLRFPRWQFDPASDTGLLAGLPTVIQTLGDRPQLAKIVWLTSPRSSLGDTPLRLIAAGKAAAVIAAAQRFALGE